MHYLCTMAKLQIAKMTVAGQISIPKPLRESFCQAGDYLTLEPYADGLLIRRVKPFQEEGTTDEKYINKLKHVTAAPNGESIDWVVDEPVCDLTTGLPLPTPHNDDAEWGEQDAPEGQQADSDEPEDPEAAAKVRKEMWKALLDSRAL